MSGVGFFTAGAVPIFPHPQIPLRTILLLEKVIKEAWRLLKKDPPSRFHLNTAPEDTITEILVEILEDTLRQTAVIPGFNTRLFGPVEREAKRTNYNKVHPDKMPDILFHLNREHLPVKSSQDGLYVECKPIDQSHSLRSAYCEKGVIRFVNGDYAWAMQEALMVGYLRNNKTYSDLTPHLLEEQYNTTDFFIAESNTTCISTHDRHFLCFTKVKPGPIKIHHLWLKL